MSQFQHSNSILTNSSCFSTEPSQVQERDFISGKLASKSPRVLLTGTNRWPSPARLAIGLSKGGCRVSAVCLTHHPLFYTRSVQQIFPYSSLHPLESLQTAIDATDPQIIIPCDDRAVLHLQELFWRARNKGAAGAKIAALIELSLGSPESYLTVSSRYDVLRIACEEGLRVPSTKLVTAREDFKCWEKGQPTPWVLKADGTFGGLGVRIAYDRDQAEQFYLEMSRPHRTVRVIKRLVVNRDPFWLRPWWKRSRPAVIVQSHINGRPANCAVVCWKGRVLAGFSVEVLLSEGPTGPARVVRVVDNPDMMLAAKRIARRLSLSGFFGLDFMIEEQTGLTYLIEMNPRCTPLCHLQLGKGRDMVGALCAQLSCEPLRETPPVTESDVIVFFPQSSDCRSSILQPSFLDVPSEEPELVRELLRPWPDRSLLFRLSDVMTRHTSPRSIDSKFGVQL